MLTVDAAFERIGSALRQMGYTTASEQKLSDAPDDRRAEYASPNMSVRLHWMAKARMLALQVKVDKEWVEFARRGFGPNGLEDSAVESLVRSLHKEVAETSTDAG
jgi:hypothetical protein